MTATARRSVRCAIYTRVSTESDLDQDFNSLDAQYDAANGFAERLIGSIRVSAPTISSSSARHICTQILQTYARYYNKIRTHRSLHKDAPISRPVLPTGSIKSHLILGGLHHHYVRGAPSLARRPRRLTMYLATLDCATSNPSLSSSP